MKFVYAKNEIIISKNIVIKKYEIGLENKVDGDKSLIQFVNHENPIWLSSDLFEVFDPCKTGDQYEKKVCNRCNRLLPREYFQKNQNGKDNRTVRRPSCNDCRSLIDGTKVLGKYKKEWENKKPHLEIWECPICKKKTIPGLTSKVVLDHDHKTGIPRAWICDSCNTGLGRFEDDIEVIKQAIKYLENS